MAFFLDSLQYVHVFLLLVRPALQTCLTGAEEKDHLLSPARDSLTNAAQEALDLCCKGALLAHSQPVPQVPSGPFLQSCFPDIRHSACTGAWSYSFPGAGLDIFLC